MNRDACHPRREPSYEEEVALVRELLAKGDRAHALHHCTSAVGLGPDRSEWHALLADLLGDRALLDRVAAEPYFGSQAARAFHFHEHGELAAAVSTIAAVHAAVPHLGFAQWLLSWIEEASAAGIALDATPLFGVLLLGYSFGVGRMRLLPAEVAAAEELVPVAILAMGLTEDGRIALLASAILRRAGRYDEAIAAAERAKPFAPREQYLVARGLALRGKRDFEGSLAAFEEAHRTTGDVVHVAEKMRVLADAGRWAEAIGAHAELVSGGRGDAENAAEYAALERLALANSAPPSEPPFDLVRRRILGHGQLVPMLDATANALRQIGGDEGLRAKGPAGAGAAVREGKVRMGVSGIEGPSNRLCMALMLTGATDPRLASYSSTDAEIRTVRDGNDPFALWRRDEDVVVQAIAPPAPHVSEWIEQLALRERDGTVAEAAFASTPDFLDLWAMSREAPPPTARARDWVAALVHPRMPVIRVCEGPEWMYRWQICAAIGLARSEPGWARTEKREALLALLRGALDWPLAAAIRVAAELALEDVDTTRDLRQALIDMTSAVLDQPNSAIPLTLLGALDMLPYVPKEYPTRVRTVLEEARQLDDSAPAPAPAGPVPAAPAPAPAAPAPAAPAAATVAATKWASASASPPAPPPASRKRPWWKLW